MALPARQFVECARVLHVEDQLHPLHLSYLVCNVSAEVLDLPLFALSFVEDGGVIGHESIVLGADKDNLSKLREAFTM